MMCIFGWSIDAKERFRVAMKESMTRTLDSWRVDVVAGLLSFLLFAPAARYGLVNFDDWGYVLAPEVRAGFTVGGVGWAFTTFAQGNWHPLTWLSYMVDVAVFGGSPAAHHLVNAALHGVVVALVSSLLRPLGVRGAVRLIVALWFGLHPLRVESVVWISERKDLLCALFYLLTIVAWARFVRSGRFGDVALAVVAGMLAALAKPMAVTLPIALVIITLWPLRHLRADSGRPWVRVSVRSMAVALAPFAALSVALSLVTMHAQHRALQAGEPLSLPARIENATVALARYLENLVAPHDLAVLYGRPVDGWPAAVVVVSVVVVVAAVVVPALLWRRQPVLLAAAAWFVALLLPVLGIVQIGLASRADRYTYLPAVGLTVVLSLLLDRQWDARRRVIAPAAAVILCALSAVTVAQSQVWATSWDLFQNTVIVEPDNGNARTYLAGIALAAGDLAGAESEARGAITVRPRSAFARLMLGRVLVRQGRFAEAAAELRQAVHLSPASVEARLYLAAALLPLGEPHEAVAALDAADEIGGGDDKAHRAAGLALLAVGELEAARPHLEFAARTLTQDAGLRAALERVAEHP